MCRLFCIILTLCALTVSAQQQTTNSFSVTHLTVDLIEETDAVYSKGFKTSVELPEYDFDNPLMQVAEINTTHPRFGWQVESKKAEFYQTAYRLLVASSLLLLREGSADVWDSGDVPDSNSTGIVFRGRPLPAGAIYYYTVKVFDQKHRCSAYAAPKGFIVSPEPDDACASLPLQKSLQMPVVITHPNHSLLLDFGTDAFSQVRFRFTNVTPNQPITVRLGELSDSCGVCTRPGGSKRYAVYHFTLDSAGEYSFEIRKDKRNTNPNDNESGVSPIFMPKYIGEVYPFRYCQIEGYNGSFLYRDALRSYVHYPFNDNAADFSSSDTVLNRLWELCKHSMKATSFSGKFVDGDRERIPYASAALINQLSFYATDAHYSIARTTLEHIINNPTCRTEDILLTLFLAWNDYLYTGDDFILKKYYPQLKNNTLMYLRKSDGLLYTGDGVTGIDNLQKVGFRGNRFSDLIDISDHTAGVYDRGKCNTVTNAFHFKSLMLLADIATAIGNKFDADNYRSLARVTQNSVNTMLTDSCGIYVDALGSVNKSLLANMYALNFGLVDDLNRGIVKNYVLGCGMDCSVYGAQFLLDALFDQGLEGYGLRLLTDTSSRSFYNMIRSGSTVTTEAWNDESRPDQVWNSAYGAAPANIIMRKIMGIEPLTAGFATVSIAPKPSSLSNASITVPSPRGKISVRFEKSSKKFDIYVEIPPNCRARVRLPYSKKYVWVGCGKHHLSEPHYSNKK
ncbi:MAG: alpha-L-rhamnosidase [Bacteroidales bacterium]|nr:alpha-L-rhamnosidase [Bacteroidales bacterium]